MIHLRLITAAAAAALLAAAPVTAQQHAPLSQAQSDVQDVHVTRVRLSTGVELQVAQAGAAGGAPVLFLHGYPDSWYSFARVLSRLPAGVRAIVPTQRGHGDSERPACCYRIADFAADAVALLDALGISRATVVGHSAGSFVAQRIAVDSPDRVARLVLVGSGATIRTEPLVEFNVVVQALTDPIAPQFVREFQESTVLQPVPAAFMDTIVMESGKLPARVWRDVLAGLLAADVQDELIHIQAPALSHRTQRPRSGRAAAASQHQSANGAGGRVACAGQDRRGSACRRPSARGVDARRCASPYALTRDWRGTRAAPCSGNARRSVARPL